MSMNLETVISKTIKAVQESCKGCKGKSGNNVIQAEFDFDINGTENDIVVYRAGENKQGNRIKLDVYIPV